MANKPAVKKTDLGRNNQKMKPFFVYDFLMRNSNAETPVKTERIIEYLEELGIGAERRSIYKDIEEINKALILTTRKDYDDLPKAETFEEAEELLKDDKEKTCNLMQNEVAGFMRVFGRPEPYPAGLRVRVTRCASSSGSSPIPL